jgi:AraC-like DNA-binding protein
LSPVCHRVRCERAWHLDQRWAAGLRDFDLWFVASGRGRMRTSDGEIVLAPGVCIWMRPGRRYEASHDPAAPLVVNCCHFTLRSRGRGFVPPVEVMQVADLEFVDVTMRRVIALRAEASAEALHSAETMFGALLWELLREAGARAAAPRLAGIALHHREVIQTVIDEIRENPGRPHLVTRLARRAGYSVDHFSRVFAAMTGRRPRDFVIEARIRRAGQLLAETSLTAGQIAEMLGYHDVFHFSRQFRAKLGRTPTAWRAAIVHAKASGGIESALPRASA